MTTKTFMLDVIYRDHSYIDNLKLALATIDFRIPCFIKTAFNTWADKLEVIIECNKKDADIVMDILTPFA